MPLNPFGFINQLKSKNLKAIKQILLALGIKSLDKICFRDKDLKIIDWYSNYVMFSNDVIAVDEFMKYLKKQDKDTNGQIAYVELLRK